MSGCEQEGLESRFYRRFDTDEELVTQLLSCKLRPGELAILKKLAKAREIGLTKALTRLKSAASRTELESHVETFCSFGPAGLLSVGAQRGGDFITESTPWSVGRASLLLDRLGRSCNPAVWPIRRRNAG